MSITHGSTACPRPRSRFPTGRYNPYYGLSYFSALAYRTCGAEVAKRRRGIALGWLRSQSPYHLYASRVSSAARGPRSRTSSMASTFPSRASRAMRPALQQGEWKTRLAALSATVDKASDSFSPEDPAKIAPILADGLAQTNALLADLAKSSLPEDARYNMTHELLIKQHQFNDALAQALALTIVATVAPGGRSAGGASWRRRRTGAELSDRDPRTGLQSQCSPGQPEQRAGHARRLRSRHQ